MIGHISRRFILWEVTRISIEWFCCRGTLNHIPDVFRGPKWNNFKKYHLRLKSWFRIHIVPMLLLWVLSLSFVHVEPIKGTESYYYTCHFHNVASRIYYPPTSAYTLYFWTTPYNLHSWAFTYVPLYPSFTISVAITANCTIKKVAMAIYHLKLQ